MLQHKYNRGRSQRLEIVDKPVNKRTGLSTICIGSKNQNKNKPLLDTLETSYQKLSRVETRKTNCYKISQRIMSVDNKLANRMAGCGSFHTIARLKCNHESAKSIHHSFRCKSKLCEYCARQRSNKIEDKFTEPLKRIQNEMNLKPYLMTFTFKHSQELPDKKILQNIKRKLFRSRLFSDRGYFGSIGTLEIKKSNKKNLWNYHFHFIVYFLFGFETITSGPNINRLITSENQLLSDVWKRCNKNFGESYIVDGRNFDGRYREVFKYVTKFDDIDNWSPKRLEEFVKWIKNKRTLFTNGKMFNNTAMKQIVKDIENEKIDNNEQQQVKECEDCGCKDYTISKYKYDTSKLKYNLVSITSATIVAGELVGNEVVAYRSQFHWEPNQNFLIQRNETPLLISTTFYN